MTAQDLPPELATLCRTLRELRAETGMSLTALAAKTSYSKSSWERYLNGHALPPRQSVEQLCALAGADPRRPLTQWDLAETVWSGRAGEVRENPATQDNQAVQSPGAPAHEPRPRTIRLRRWAYGATTALVIVAATSAVLNRPGTPPAPLPEVGVRATATGPGCHGAACSGKDAEDLECSNFAAPPTTLGEKRLDGTMVKVRHSALCETVWARIDRGSEGDLVEILVPDVPVQQATVKDRFDAMGSLSTPMAPAVGSQAKRVSACLVREGERHCFTTATVG
ncbi:helix-turn-helix transcriptional regulator [Streptomyces sp. NPDC051784]|uniref:helix-turn-helix domain-containing protein n=1 Tax=Streptomyces sp. NPDC051784 TaxID=3155805 RepID=UPI0034344260